MDLSFLKSKKLFSAFGAFVVVLVSQLLIQLGIDIPQSVIETLVNVSMVHIAGQSAVDLALVVKGNKTK